MKFYTALACLFIGSLASSPPPPNCPAGTLPRGGGCMEVKYVEGCSAYSDTNKCGKCEDRYLPQTNGLCYLNKASTACKNSTNSNGCALGLYPNGASCI